MNESSRKTNILVDLHQAGRYDELQSLCRKRVELLRERYGHEHVKVGLALKQLAFAFYEMQDYSASEESLLESMKILGPFYGHASKLYTVCLTDLARLCIFQERTAEAEQLLTETLELLSGLPLSEQLAYTPTLINWAKLHLRRKDFNAAEQSLEKAKERILQQEGADHRIYAILLHHLSDVYSMQNRIADAVRIIREAIEVFKKASHTESIDYAMAISSLGVLLESRGDRVEALTCQSTALDILRRLRPEGHPNIQKVNHRIGALGAGNGTGITDDYSS